MPLFVGSKRLDSICCRAKDVFSFPQLVQRSKAFALQPTRHLASSDMVLYVSQREHASVRLNDESIKFVGSADATTCHIIVLESQLGASVGHFDGCDTEMGLQRMLEQHKNLHRNVSNNEEDFKVNVHIIGGFDDQRKISLELLESVLIFLAECPFYVQLVTLCSHVVNTKIVNDMNAPVVYGVAYDLNLKQVFSASFGGKGPFSAIRSARIYGGSDKMTCIYNGIEPVLTIEPFMYNVFDAAYIIPQLPDDVVLKHCSTSPHCEPHDFVQATKDTMKFLTANPDPREVFPNGTPLRFVMNEQGIWNGLKT